MHYFEDIECDVVHRFGSYEVTRQEVIEFAEKYDPQPFHLSDKAAARTHFGRISASGWHTCAMTMRMMVEYKAAHGYAGLGSPGVDNVRWLRPVYPGDTLRCEIVTLTKRISRSKPEIGILKSRISVYNQDDERVMSMEVNEMIRTRGDRP